MTAWICVREDCLCRRTRRPGCACRAIHGDRFGICTRCTVPMVAVTRTAARAIATAAERRRRT